MKKTQTKNGLFRYILTTVAFLIIIAIIVIFLNREPKPFIVPPPAVEIVQPEKRTITQSITLYGYIEARDTIPVVPLVNGTIVDYPVQAGTFVEEGTLLAVIDKAPFEQQVYQARAAFGSYQSAFTRVEQLYENAAATLQDYETIKAQRDSAEAQLELAELQLSYTDVKAPVSGTVLMAPSAKGNIGNSQQPVAIIADLTKQVVRLAVPEKYFDLFNTNAENLFAQIKRAGVDDTIELQTNENLLSLAKIESVAPYIEPQTKTFEVVFELTENIDIFRPGMFAEISVVYNEKKDIYTLPLSVLKADKSCYTVELLTSQDENITAIAHWQNIPSNIKDSYYFEIPESYANNFFISSGQNAIFDKQEVVIVENSETITNKDF